MVIWVSANHAVKEWDGLSGQEQCLALDTSAPLLPPLDFPVDTLLVSLSPLHSSV